jgi:hypothetical protein
LNLLTSKINNKKFGSHTGSFSSLEAWKKGLLSGSGGATPRNLASWVSSLLHCILYLEAMARTWESLEIRSFVAGLQLQALGARLRQLGNALLVLLLEHGQLLGVRRLELRLWGFRFPAGLSVFTCVSCSR